MHTAQAKEHWRFFVNLHYQFHDGKICRTILSKEHRSKYGTVVTDAPTTKKVRVNVKMILNVNAWDHNEGWQTDLIAVCSF